MSNRFLRWLFNQKFVLNTRSGEIHDLRRDVKNCARKRMAKHNAKYLTQKQVDQLVKEGKADGCQWCMGHINHPTYRK